LRVAGIFFRLMLLSVLILCDRSLGRSSRGSSRLRRTQFRFEFTSETQRQGSALKKNMGEMGEK
jgi:hypothetical protein